MYGGSGFAYQSVGLAGVSDSVFVTGGGLQLTETYGFRGGYNHNWDPHWSSGFYGAMGWVHYNGTAVNAICFNAASLGGFRGSCNPNFNVSSIGMITRWTPVKNFTFSFDVAATHLDQNFVGTWSLPTQILIGKPAATFEAKDQTAVSALARVQRNF
jgi:Porin subfamily